MAIKSLLRVKLQLLALLLTIIIPSSAIASVITGADYTGTITVTNNGTAATNVSTNMTLNSASLINNFGVATDFSDVVIRNDSGADVAFMPSVNSSYPWVLWDSSIAANSAQTMSIYLKDVSGGKLRWFPGAGGGSVADSVSLELGDNFSTEHKGYLDTSAGANKYLTKKEQAFETFVDPSVAGTITSRIYASPTTVNLVPDGVGDYTNITSSTGATHWGVVDDPPGVPDDADYVSKVSTGELKDAYTTQNGTFVTTDTINSVTVFFRVASVGAGNTYLTPYLRLGTNETTGTVVTHVGSTFTNYSEVLARPGGGSWLYSDIASLQVGIGLFGSVGETAKCSQVYIQVSYTSVAASVSAAGVASGEHTVIVGVSSVQTTITQSVLSSTQGVWNGAVTRYGERFNSFPESIIDSVTIKYGNLVGSPTGTASITLRDVATDAILGTFGTQNVALITQAEFTYSTPVTLSTSQDVRICFEFTGGNASNYPRLSYNNTSVYAGGVATSYNAGWTDTATADAYFIVKYSVGTFSLSFNGVVAGTDSGVIPSVPNNANPLVFCSGATQDTLPMPYVEYIKTYKGGALSGSWAWQYLTSWIDQSGNGNTATPTFRIASSDADVSASLTSLQPVTVSASNASPSSSWPNIIAAAPPQQSTMYMDNSTTAGYPGFIGASVVHAILQAVPAIPETWFWYNMCMLFVIACGILAFALHPSLVLKGVVMAALMVYFAADGVNVWGGYIVLYFVFFWFGVWIVSRSYGL